MFFLRKNHFLILLIFILAVPLYSKAKKSDFSIPSKYQKIIDKNQATTKSWYICELKDKTKAGKVMVGPLDNRIHAVLIWVTSSIKPDKDYCIVKNTTYITKNPEVLFADEYKKVQADVKEFGKNDTFEKYFLTDYLTQTNSISINSSDFDFENLSIPDEILEALQENDLPAKPESSVENEAELEPESKIIEPAEKVLEKNKTESSDISVIHDTIKLTFVDKLEQASDDSEQEILEPANEVQTTQLSSINEIIPETVQKTTALVSQPEQNPNTSLNQSETKSASVAIQPENQTIISTEKEPEPQKKSVLPSTKKEPQTVSSPAFNFSTNNNSSTVSRYQKEYLQDYAPKKQIDLPSDSEDYTLNISNPNEADSRGTTLLMTASKNGNLKEVKKLIILGADPNLKDKDGWTALMYAIRYQSDLTVVDALIDAGSSVKYANNLSITPLKLAVAYNENPEILRKILSYYSNSERDVLQSLIILLSDNSNNVYSLLSKIDVYINKSIQLNSFYNGKTPLMYAVQYSNSTAVIKKLIDSGAVTSIRSTEGKTVFDYAEDNTALPHDNIYWTLNKK